MGITSSTTNKCGFCSQSDSTRPSVSPGCCNQSYHLECLKTHLGTRNTTCPKCHHVFPSNILDLDAATATTAQPPQPPLVIPQAQVIPVQQQQQQLHPPPPPLPPPPRGYRGRLEPSKEMHAEEPVSEWTPPPASSDKMPAPEVEVLIECSPELPQASLPAVTGFNSVVSVSASSQSVALTDDSPSPPMDIVCILDVSGSMGCNNKLSNLKCAVNFMRDELKENDRMSVITFERSASRIHGLLKMTPANKGRTEAYINELSPGGGTRILTGLHEAHQVLQSRQTKNPISSVFLLTDGIDASDLREKKRIAKEIKEMGASLFVYGFGNDHDSQHLKSIADAGEGTFTFIEQSDMVIDAFGGALGAEKSIFAQNLCLTLTAAAGAKITNVHAGAYRKLIDLSGASAKVYFPNLMMGEQRDVLMVMDLPAVSGPEEVHTIMSTGLEYTPIVPASGAGTGTGVVSMTGQDCTISRVETVDTQLERNTAVDVQVNRVLLDSTTTASLALADQGDYVKAKKNLNSTLATMKESASCRQQDEKTVAFVSELEATINSIENENVYHRGGGRSMMSEMASNIGQQRCTYAKAGRSKAYQNESSMARQEVTNTKKMKFFSK